MSHLAPSLVVATAPGRCGIVGNPTDMYGGSVISCTTQERARCEIRDADELTLEADDTRQVIASASDLAPRGDRLDLARAVLRGLRVEPHEARFHLRTSTDIPMQAGLAGSTALVAAVFGAVARKLGKPAIGRHQTAEAIRAIEYREMGVICGFQDQYMTVFGGLNFMDFRDKGSHLDADQQPLATIEPLPDLPPLPLILAHTGVAHHSGAAHKPVRQRWLDGDPEVRQNYEYLQRRTRRMKLALFRGDLRALATLMNENQQIQQDLGASGEACDRLVRVALDAGAWAAKLAGAGQGGTIIALAPDNKDAVVDALKAAGAGRILFPAPSPGLTVE